MAFSLKIIFNFSLLGKFVNLTYIAANQCTKDDYKDWSPSDKMFESCLLGRKQVYERKIANALCYNGREYEREISVQNCSCAISDYEW